MKYLIGFAVGARVVSVYPDLAPYVNEQSPTQLQSLHFYSFGDFSRTARFAHELAMSGTR